MTPDSPIGAHSGRIHAFDGLRGFAMLLGIFLHAAIPYMTFDIPWLVRDARPSLAFDTLVGAVHPFRMQLFFFVAGFFAQMLYGRLGASGFIRHRFQRIFIPFAAGMIVIAPMVLWLWDGPLGPLPPAHLWFLEYLLILYAVALALALLAKRLVNPAVFSLLDAAFQRLLRSAWKPFLLGAPVVLIMWFSPMWADVEGGPGRGIVPNVRGLAYYGFFFAFGWYLHRNGSLLPEIERRVWGYLLPAGIAFLVMGGLLFFEPRRELPYYLWLKLGCLSAAALYTWLMVFGLTGFFLRYFNKPSATARYVADSSYWLYLTHLPLVLFLQKLWAAQDWSSFAKFACVNATTLAVLGLSYHFLVRHTFIGALLNGPRSR